MVRVIGKGLEALAKWFNECVEAGGVPLFRVQYGGVPFKDKLIVACYGAAAKVRGGVIEDLPADLVEKIRMAKGADWRVVAEYLEAHGYTVKKPKV
jgi:hypothetical protein